MRKYVGWALVLVVLAGALGWWWWWECRRERTQLQLQVDSTPSGGEPPPGPIIDIDPKGAASAVIQVDTQYPYPEDCVAVTAGRLNKWWIGSIRKFEALVKLKPEDPARSVQLKRVVIPWKFQEVTKTLVIERASSGFNYVYDGQVLTPIDHGSGSKRVLRQDFCEGEVDGGEYSFVYFHPDTGAEVTLNATDIAIKIKAVLPN
jgi:hypothetical protein